MENLDITAKLNKKYTSYQSETFRELFSRQNKGFTFYLHFGGLPLKNLDAVGSTAIILIKCAPENNYLRDCAA